MPVSLDQLNHSQRQAATHVDGPMLVLAGPGSGKTRVITYRIAHLLQQGIDASKILALTFTNKAADEMSRRVAELAPGEQVWVSTFHRFCSRLLRRHASLVGLEPNFTIYDTDDTKKMLARVAEEIGLPTSTFSPDEIRRAISQAKNQLITAQDFPIRPGVARDRVVGQMYAEYQQRMLAASAVDFDDLLMHVGVMMRENPELRAALDARYQYILVDEYQDTNLAQYAVVRALSIDHPNLAVTGDPDQSIYGWRGANLQNILDFESDYDQVKVVRLERNYRSTKRILSVAEQLITHNQRRKPKGLYTENDDGRPVRLARYTNEVDEAQSIAQAIRTALATGRRRANEIAIFYRINALSRALEKALVEHGIPYQMLRGLEFYQRKEIKDVLAYLSLLNNPRDDVAFLRVINTPPRRIGKATVLHIRKHAIRRGVALLEAARDCSSIEGIAARSAKQVASFVAMQDRLAQFTSASVHEILIQVLAESGYEEFLSGGDVEEDTDRLANIQELLTAAREFDTQHGDGPALETFLEQTSLASDTDDLDATVDKVSLMSLHASKGLEFPVVYLIAMEQGILPHERRRSDLDELEEERRLLFVGITRAEQELQLSFASRRSFRGQTRPTIPSSFLMELPRGEMEMVEPEYEAFEYTSDVDVYDADDEFPTTYIDEESPASTLGAEPTITTAAELQSPSDLESSNVSPNEFTNNMVVLHPEYGPGKIVGLSGTGKLRRATVRFATAGEKRFVLDKSPLRPAPR